MFDYKECAFLQGNVTWKQVSNQETVGDPLGGPGGGLQPGVLPGGGLQPGVFGGGPITGVGVGREGIGVRPRVWPGGGRVQPWPGVSGGRPGLCQRRIFGYATEMEYYGNPEMPLSSVILSNSLSQPICTSQTSRSTKLPEFVVALNDIYLLNCIIFDPYPEELTETIENLGFSYILKISRDSSHWNTFIDYTGYYCYGRQYIILPTIAVR